MGITFGLGSGATAVIAKSIGENNKQKADNAAEHTIFLGIILSIIFITVGYLFGNKIISFQGATSEVAIHASDYFFTMLYGTFFMIISVFCRGILSGEGDNILPMKILGLGTLINLILDPIFIYFYQIKGAALATGLSIIFWNYIFLVVSSNCKINLKRKFSKYKLYC